jgi:hypothetical protein
MEVGDILFVITSSDNASSSTPTITVARDSGTATLGSWSLNSSQSEASPAAGVITNIARAVVTGAGTLGNVTVTFSTAVVAKAVQVICFRGVDTTTPVASAGSYTGTLDYISIGAAWTSGRAYLHAVSWEGTTSDWMNLSSGISGWTSETNGGTSGGGAASNCSLQVSWHPEALSDPNYVQGNFTTARESSTVLLGLNQAPGGPADKTTSDTAKPKATESIGVDVTAPASDALAPKVTESVLVENEVPVSDSIKPKITESVAVEISAVLSDDAKPKVTESISISATAPVTESALLKVTESLAIDVTISTSDTLAPKTTESIVLDSSTQVPLADALKPKIVESISIDVSVSTSDSAKPKVTESFSITSDVNVSDSAKPKVVESAPSVQSTNAVAVSDDIKPKITESIQISVSVAVSDQAKIKTIESMSGVPGQVSIKFYNGSTWVVATAVKAWNGSAWVNVAGIKKHNGSSWT